jgi:DNA (cytosine-5)-methyltransferase 1
MTNPLFLIIDLFCGFGGTTLGFQSARLRQQLVALVIACVNHDKKAIKSHWLNHPDVEHFEEDIRKLDLARLVRMVRLYQAFYPEAKLILWASLECTNFSKAKGGLPRDRDSRTLANDLFRYVDELRPDYVMIENVVEFMAWGPLDERGKPISRRNGEDWLRWRNSLCGRGYTDDWREINSANLGAFTSRNRLFGVFAKEGLPIAFPQATHSKGGKLGLNRWRAVREVLDCSDKGISVFERKKPLSPKTFKRLSSGVRKFVPRGQNEFMQQYFSGEDMVRSMDNPCPTVTAKDHNSPVFITKWNSTGSNGKVSAGSDANEPCPTVTVQLRLGVVQPQFLMQSNGGLPSAKVYHPDGPSRVVTTSDNQALVTTEFLSQYHGNGCNYATDRPATTLSTRDRLALVEAEQFILRDFTSGDNNRDLDRPMGAILPNPKANLVSAEWLLDNKFNNVGESLETPARALLTGNHQYLVCPNQGEPDHSTPSPDDVPEVAELKSLMREYGIADIKMRMLRVKELLRIQGFPPDYQMVGTQEDHKKFIGNAVVPLVAKRWAEALAEKLLAA